MGGSRMKKYWKIVVVLTITVITIGTHYIRTSYASQTMPEFEIKKISGDEKELQNLIIYGEYNVGDFLYYSFKILNGKTININQDSIISEIVELPSQFETIMKEHKNFLRQKVLIPGNFYEDKGWLAYAEYEMEPLVGGLTNRNKFIIDVMNKKTDETVDFEVAIPDSENYYMIDINDVQLMNGKVKVLATNYSDDESEEAHLYVFDIKEKKLIRDDVILKNSEDGENGKWTSFSINNDNFSLKPSEYALILLQSFQKEMNENSKDVETKISGSECYVYNFEKEVLEKINNEEQGVVETASLHNSTVFLQSMIDDRLEVVPYDIETGTWREKSLFNVPQTSRNTDNGDLHAEPFITVLNGKIYIINAIDDGYSLFIGDLSTGKSLYEGKIVAKHKKVDQYNDKTYFRLIELKS